MKQYAVIGIGRFGEILAINLYKQGCDVIVIDRSEEKINAIADKVTYAVQADASDINALKAIGMKNVDVAIISIGSNMESSILATLNAKELGIKEVYAKAQSEQHFTVLKKLGADKVFSPEHDMGVRVAYTLVSDHFMDLLELDPEHSIIEIKALKDWHKKSLQSLNLRSVYGINIIGIKRDNKLNAIPNADDIIKKGDIIVLIGKNKEIKKIRNLKSLEE
jgi:trk system potassium uptake protein TrkA